MSLRPKEITVCGLKAVRSLFSSDPASIRRLFFVKDQARELGYVCHILSQNHQVYRCVEQEELERIAGTVHHGGVVAVVEAAPLRRPSPDELRQWGATRTPVLVLDCISNTHNLGAIIRTAAFFGVTKVVLPDHPSAALPSDATYRVAEGGMDHVEVFLVNRLDWFLDELRKSYLVIGAASDEAQATMALSRVRSLGPKPIALVLGNEEEGLAEEIATRCDGLVTIPGSGRVESLNVSAAAAILLWECAQQELQQRRTPQASSMPVRRDHSSIPPRFPRKDDRDRG